MQLPNVKGSNLLRQNQEFPRDFAGELNLVFIAFLRRHQDLIDQWVPVVQGLVQKYPQLHYYEFPTLPESNFIYRLFLNEGMRAGIPSSDTRSRTITLYLDKNEFRAALDIPDEKDLWLYLFDQGGTVLWRAKGVYTQAKELELVDALNSA